MLAPGLAPRSEVQRRRLALVDALRDADARIARLHDLKGAQRLAGRPTASTRVKLAKARERRRLLRAMLLRTYLRD